MGGYWVCFLSHPFGSGIPPTCPIQVEQVPDAGLALSSAITTYSSVRKPL